ncbi:5'-nucleotidase C-terminal domain-containing protein [Shouchella sp. JSM 1781072]|uniref:5'-nucleotidase C-terminal domain-containing protein n=1 Tax=Bacillaceae TaxID=186817 RepID=UPI000C081790|nr:5'-nucleotidase C-terminal domain-containing protein [Bacillus sp. Marseille-P3800]
MEKWKKWVGASLVALTLPIGFSGEAHAQEKTLNIFHTNDIHASFEEYGKVSAYVNQQREALDHVLFLDAGDFASGNPVVDLNFGKPMIDVFNLAGLDGFVIGNHEFDYGQTHLQENIEDSSFPWLGANMDSGDTSVDNPDPYVVIDVDGVDVGILGITQAPPATAPANVVGMTFDQDYAATALAYQDELEEQADVIVALTHIGHDQDRRLAEAVDYFDVIIGGHSHTTLSQPAVVNGTPIVQTGANLANLGELTLVYDEETDEVNRVTGGLTAVSSLTDVDEDVQAVIDGYVEEMEDVLGKVVGYSDTGLTRDGRYNGDAPLGNFWTDAMRDFAEADVALTNNGGLRDSISPGDITLNDLYTVEPFANEIMVIEMTGAAIEDVIEFSYTRGDRSQIDLQTSGLHYEITTGTTGNYLGVDLTIDGEPVQEEETYAVAVADYIGTGGSGYQFEGEVIHETVGLMTTAMEQYALQLTDAGEPINYYQEGRISVKVDPSGPNPGEIVGSTETGLYSANKNRQDVGLGNLYTDAIKAKTGSEIALLNGSSVTGEIPPGSITDRQIEALDSFGNAIVVAETTGARLKEVIEEQSRYHNGVDLQASGLTYTLVPIGNGYDLANIEVQGEAIDDNAVYTVAYNDYMHGNSFYQLGEAVEDQIGPVWQAVVDYVSEQTEPINYEEGTRIQIEGEEDPGDPSGTRSVAEAIANNSGVYPVQGYIVGSIVNQQPVIGEGTHAPSNLLLADSPDETDRNKMLPVQLVNGTAVRNGLNLVQHPDHLGQPVRITGSLEAYFSTPGMRAPSDYQWVDIGEPEEPEVPACSFDEWKADQVYTAGDQVAYNGEFYEAKWWTQGEHPSKSGQWDVWKKVADCYDTPEGPQEWNSEQIYVAGDQVTVEGKLYEAKWWTQGEDPRNSGQWDVWKKIEE